MLVESLLIMKIAKCLVSADTFLGEVISNYDYLVLTEWEYGHTPFTRYNHYGVIMNQGNYYDFLDNRFHEEREI